MHIMIQKSGRIGRRGLLRPWSVLHDPAGLDDDLDDPVKMK